VFRLLSSPPPGLIASVRLVLSKSMHWNLLETESGAFRIRTLAIGPPHRCPVTVWRSVRNANPIMSAVSKHPFQKFSLPIQPKANQVSPRCETFLSGKNWLPIPFPLSILLRMAIIEVDDDAAGHPASTSGTRYEVGRAEGLEYDLRRKITFEVVGEKRGERWHHGRVNPKSRAHRRRCAWRSLRSRWLEYSTCLRWINWVVTDLRQLADLLGELK
jgi:hypothetical protein